MSQKTPKSSPFSEAEVAAELKRLRRANAQTTWSNGHMLTCIHCGNEFDAAKGGNANIPMCDFCFHND
ncbi:hypothetical protein PSQ90_15360 [Devosia rhodophyticola]|uniref:DksA C4-type domain-containing protein n=1 Tax=Devosia rhodophyticola TaxID=3026423 RepID=A0ABY7YX10_9HYPH|nr:hypothetical protein [Devosia rhodophyticola]WDR05623.1 hypothetical protein PSQ90_15360 [Devosia rhodophyticola]